MSRIIIVGGGIVGVSAAFEFASAGAEVTLVHEGPLGGGATAAAMGHLIALDDRETIAQFTLRSLQRWDQFDLPASCERVRCGALWVAEDEQEMTEARAKATRYHNRQVEAEVVAADDLRRIEPELAPTLAGGLLVASDCVLYPPRAAAWLWERAADLGARRSIDRVVAVSPRRVQLENGTLLEGDWVIVATGDRMGELLPSMPIVPRKGHLLITARGPAFLRHQVVELGYIKKAHGRATENVACNVQPRTTGQVLIGSSRQLDNRDPAIEPHIIDQMVARAVEFLPRLPQLTALRAWTGFRAVTPDGAAVIGVLEAGLAVAGGHEGVGITQAPATAELLRHLLLGGDTDIDPAAFDPWRFREAA